MGQQMSGLDAQMLLAPLSRCGPVTRKDTSHGRSPHKGLAWASSCMQGWRDNMEDAHLALPSLGGRGDIAVFAVFDGHGGEHVARFCERHLPWELARRPREDLVDSLVTSYHQMDQMLADPRNLGELRSLSNDPWVHVAKANQAVHPDFVGCTAMVCCVRHDSVIVANAGDCRAVLCRRGEAVEMSEDHKPNLPREEARIKRAGGRVMEQRVGPRSVYRVNGDLSLSRAIGDLRYKQNRSLGPQDQAVCCTPEIRIFRRNPGDEFMIIACDGVWDVLSSQEAVDFVRARLARAPADGTRLSAIADQLLDCCLSPDLRRTSGIGGDNMTLLLVVFTGEDRIPLLPPGPRFIGI